jgi:exonuclease SbcC
MIETLTIANFLSHKETEIEFSEGVNIIIGPTDSGKSAIIKALKWLIQNRPLGDGMRSSWGGDTEVTVRVTIIDPEQLVDDSVTITRVRDNTSNGYRIGKSKFNAIKGDIPLEVSQALNLTDLNIQTQFDPHFLLGKSSGEVAQYFNKIAHLDRIDTALQNIQKWSKEVQKKVDYNTDALNGAKERLNAYGCLDAVEGILISLEEKENRRERIYKDRESLLKTIKSIQKVNEDLQEVDFLSELDDKVTSILATIKKQKELKKNLTALFLVVAAGKKIVEDSQKVDKELADMEAKFHKALGKGSVCPLCEQMIQ